MTRAAVLGGAAIAVAALAWDPSAPAADPKRALALAAITVGLALRVSGRVPADDAGRGSSTAVLALGAFVLWSGASLAWGVASGARDLATFVAGLGLALVVDGAPRDGARELARWVATATGALASVAAIAERLAGARGLAVHGGQGNANWLGLLVAVTLPLGLAAALRPGPRRALAALAVALELAGLALSHSRVAWLAAAITAAPLVVALAPAARRRLVAAALAAVVAPALAIALTRAPARTQTPRPDEDVPAPIALEGRLWIARASLDAARDALPFGVGLGGFAHAFLEAQGERLAPLPPKVASRRFLNATTAHDDWLEALVDSGPIAPALLAAALGLAAYAALASGFLEGAAALGAFALCALGDSPLRQPALVLVLGVVVGAARGASRAPRVRRPTEIAALAACAVGLAYASAAWVADRRVAAARDALPEDRLRALSAAIRLDPTNGEALLDRGLLVTATERPTLDLALADLRRSRALLANVGTDVALGNALVRAGQWEDAVLAYERALRLHPGSFRAHANVAEPLLLLGRLDEADRHLAVAAELFPGHPKLAELVERARRARLDRATGGP